MVRAQKALSSWKHTLQSWKLFLNHLFYYFLPSFSILFSPLLSKRPIYSDVGLLRLLFFHIFNFNSISLSFPLFSLKDFLNSIFQAFCWIFSVCYAAVLQELTSCSGLWMKCFLFLRIWFYFWNFLLPVALLNFFSNCFDLIHVNGFCRGKVVFGYLLISRNESPKSWLEYCMYQCINSELHWKLICLDHFLEKPQSRYH